MTVSVAASWSDLFRTGHFGKVLLLGFGVWLHAADNLMVSTVSPAMIAEIGGEAYVAWLIALYEVGSIVAGASSALAVLRLGLNKAMCGAALLYLLGCLISGFSPTMGGMLFGRLLQGLGGGALVAMAFIAVHQLIPGRLTARVYALISLIWGVSAFVGPIIGAAFADYGWWRGSFYFYAAQALLFAAFVLALLDSGDGAARKARMAGSVNLLLRLGALAGGVMAIAAAGVAARFGLQLIWGLSGLALIGFFLYLDRRAENPLLPRNALNLASLEGSAIAMIVSMSAATVGLITYGPLILTRLHGMTALEVGMLLLLESVSWSITAVLLSGLPPRMERRAIVAGFTMIAAGVVVVAATIGSGPIPAIATAAAMMGGGFGIAWSFMVRRAVELVGEGEKNRMAAAMPTVQRFGFALGAAFAGMVANASGFVTAADDAAIAYSAYWVFGLLIFPALFGLVAVGRFVRFRSAGADR
jgi:predicted MFS family arabinose efflux permease